MRYGNITKFAAKHHTPLRFLQLCPPSSFFVAHAPFRDRRTPPSLHHDEGDDFDDDDREDDGSEDDKDVDDDNGCDDDEGTDGHDEGTGHEDNGDHHGDEDDDDHNEDDETRTMATMKATMTTRTARMMMAAATTTACFCWARAAQNAFLANLGSWRSLQVCVDTNPHTSKIY